MKTNAFGLGAKILVLVLAASATQVASVPKAFATDALAKADAQSSPQVSGDKQIEWNPEWNKLKWYEYVGTGLMTAGGAYLSLGVNGPSPSWTGSNPIDNALNPHLSLSAQNTARTFSDVGVIGMLGLPALDTSLALALKKITGEAAFQVIGTDAEAMSGIFLVGASTKFVGRARPCANGPDAANCSTPGESMPSLHEMFAAGSAAQICFNHLALKLYGSPFWDKVICGLAIGGVAAVGTARVLGGEHNASDTVVGAAGGTAIGLGASLIHFGWGQQSDTKDKPGITASLEPRASKDFQGFMLSGAF